MDGLCTIAEHTVTKRKKGRYARQYGFSIIGLTLVPLAAFYILGCLFGIIGIGLFLLFFLVYFFVAVLPIHRRFFSIQYDYRVMGDEITIAEVYHKSARREIFSGRISSAEIIAPYDGRAKNLMDSSEFDRVIEAVSERCAEGIYCCVYPGEDNPLSKTLILFEPTDKMIRMMGRYHRLGLS